MYRARMYVNVGLFVSLRGVHSPLCLGLWWPALRTLQGLLWLQPEDWRRCGHHSQAGAGLFHQPASLPGDGVQEPAAPRHWTTSGAPPMLLYLETISVDWSRARWIDSNFFNEWQKNYCSQPMLLQKWGRVWESLWLPVTIETCTVRSSKIPVLCIASPGVGANGQEDPGGDIIPRVQQAVQVLQPSVSHFWIHFWPVVGGRGPRPSPLCQGDGWLGHVLQQQSP